MLRMSPDAFERAVVEALDDIPDDLAELLDNVVVQVEEEPSEEEIRSVGLDPEVDTLFGLYEGVSILERDPGSYGGALPDRIVIYRLPLLEHCRSRRELLREIRDTVIHEVGHYFGFGEEDLP